MLQLNTVLRVLEKKFTMWYVIMTTAIIATLKTRGSRYTSVATFDGSTYYIAPRESLGGEITICKSANHVISYFTLYYNYGTATQIPVVFIWKEGQDRVNIPIFFPQVANGLTGAYAPTVNTYKEVLALQGIPDSVSIVYTDRSHEILTGKWDPVAEMCKQFDNITSDWEDK